MSRVQQPRVHEATIEEGADRLRTRANASREPETPLLDLLLEAIESSPGAIAIYDREDRLIVCNRAYEAAIHPVAFRKLAARGPVRHADLVRESVSQYLEGADLEAAVRAHVEAHRRADGTPSDRAVPGSGWFRIVKRRTPGGSVVGTATDITELKETEAELRAARAEVEAALEARGRFVAQLCHELRNPLNAILGLSEKLIAEMPDTSHRDLVATLRRTGREMVDLLDDVLDHARFDHGSFTTDPVEFDLAKMIAEVGALYQPWASRKELDFVCEASSAQIRADRRHLVRITGNLLANAVKFTEHGKITLEAVLHPRRDGSVWLDVRVSDTGPGMTRGEVSNLFAEFAQLPTNNANGVKGSGLGLSIARACAEALGGTISVETEKGRGSTFALTVPVEAVETPQAGEVRPALPADRALPIPSEGLSDRDPDGDAIAVPEAAATLHNEPRQIAEASEPGTTSPGGAPGPDEGDLAPEIDVLIVEDNRINQLILESMVTRLGARPTVVENGACAVDIVSAREFDLILMDVQMPVMDGLTAVRKIRASEAETGRPPRHVVSISANVMPDFNRECVEAGFDAVLAKPIEIEQIRELIDDTRVRRAGDVGPAAASRQPAA